MNFLNLKSFTHSSKSGTSIGEEIFDLRNVIAVHAIAEDAKIHRIVLFVKCMLGNIGLGEFIVLYLAFGILWHVWHEMHRIVKWVK